MTNRVHVMPERRRRRNHRADKTLGIKKAASNSGFP
jgi:hypothetical protein